MCIRVPILVVVLGFLGGCATPVFQSPPPGPTPEQHTLGRVTLFDQTDHMTGHLNSEKTILFHQEFGGGGAALGLLAGPFGVMANIGMIEEVTQKEIAKLNGQLALDPVRAFKETAANYGFGVTGQTSDSAVILSPYLYVTKPDPDTFSFASALLVDYTGVGQKWVGKYMHQLPTALPSEAIKDGLSEEELSVLRVEMAAGMRAVLQLYTADIANTLATVRKGNFRTCGSMGGEGKRSDATWPEPPRPSSAIPNFAFNSP